MLVYVTTHTRFLSITVILLAVEMQAGITVYSLGKDLMRSKALSQKCLVINFNHYLRSQKCLG